MKRILSFITLLLLTAALGGLIVKAALPEPAEGEATVVVHFHKWDGNYENVGGHTWGGKVLVKVGEEYLLKDSGVQPTGSDDFGIYFTYRFTAGATAADLGFIPVMASEWKEDGTIVQNWDAKLSAADVIIPVKEYAAGSTHHIYVFEGSKGLNAKAEEGEVPYLIANPDMVNLLVLFYDPNNNYHENLGVHSWSWSENQNADGGWNTPLQIFKNVAMIGTTPVKGFMFTQTADAIGNAGLLIYHGDGDASKYSGDIKKEVTPDLGIYAEGVQNGLVTPVFVLNTGAGNSSNSNVFYGEALGNFGVEAFSFRFDLGSIADGTGTFAMNKRVVYTLFSQSIVTQFTKLDEEEKDAAKAEIMSRFSIVEVVDGEPTTNTVAISEINFNEYADDTKEFILTLGADLDHTKDYRVLYTPALAPEQILKERTIKFEVTAPEGTPNVYIVGSLNNWTAGSSNWKMTKGEGNVWTFEVKANLLPKTFEYKYLYAPDWAYEEDVPGNRSLVIGDEEIIEVKDEIVWKTAPVDGAEYPPENDPKTIIDDEPVPAPDAIFAALDLDKSAPEFVFQTEFSSTTDENIGVIEIQRYSKWDQTLFPRFRVSDERDGNITHRVYVPEDTEFKVLDTNTLGDYKILLRVVDDWGHVTEKVFIFRVVAKVKK